MNQKGLIERDGTPKESYYIFQSFWSDKPMIRLFGHEWQTRWGKPGEAKQIRVYSNCSEVELIVNGKSMGVKKRNSQDYPAAGLRWDVVLNEGPNQVKAIAVKEKISDEIKVGYQSTAWGKPAKLALTELERKDGVVTLQAKIFDAKGVPCLDSATLVRFDKLGDAQLIDNLGTSTGSRAVQLYNGRAIIKARLLGTQAVFSLSSTDLETQYLTLKK
jgi:beta-galactosidase